MRAPGCLFLVPQAGNDPCAHPGSRDKCDCVKYSLPQLILAAMAGAGLGFGAATLSRMTQQPTATSAESTDLSAAAVDAAPIVRIDTSGSNQHESSSDRPKERGAEQSKKNVSRKPSIPAVVKEMEKIRSEPANKRTKQRESDVLDQWIELDPAGAAAWAAKVFAAGGDEQLLREAVRGYARRDPRAAAAWASSLASPLVRDSALREVFEAWSARDPRSAAAEVALLPIGTAQSTAATVVGKYFAGMDMDGALAWMVSLAAPAQGAAFQAIMRSQWDKTGATNPGAALPWLLAQSSSSVREQGIRFIAAEWAKRDPLSALANANLIAHRTDRNLYVETALRTYTQTNPREAAAWLATQPSSPETGQLMNQVVAAWAAFEPRQTAQWANALDNPALRTKSIATVAESWAKADPAAVADWFGNLQDSAARDAAIDGATRVWMRSDPAGAAQWATTIVDRGKRNTSITQVVREWKSHDLASALAFIGSTPAIDDNLRQRLLR